MKGLFIGYALFWLLAVAGWGQCVYKFVNCDFEPSYKAEVLYGIGVFSPAGAVIGWFNIGE